MKVDYLLTIRCEREESDAEKFAELFSDFRQRVEEVYRTAAAVQTPSKDTQLRWLLISAKACCGAL